MRNANLLPFSMAAIGSGREAQSAAFVRHQNMIRGALGHRRKRGFNPEPETNPNLVLRTNIRRAFLSARALLDNADFGVFLEWYGWARVAELGAHGEGAIGFDYLNGIVEGPIVPLSKEVAWISARLFAEIEALKRFRMDAGALDAMCVRGLYDEALTKLQTIVEMHGESMWSVQLRLAIAQRSGGLEAQKAFLELFRAQHRQGILSYIAYNTSVRNEDRTSWNRFSDSIRSSSAKRRDKSLADYLNYRLLNEWPTTAHGIANVLRVEQSHSIIDIYETFVNLSQRAMLLPELEGMRPGLVKAALSLAEINDFRLHKLAQISLGERPADASAALASGRPAAALKAAKKGLLSRSDPWSAIYSAAAFVIAGKEIRFRAGLFSDLISRFMSVRKTTAQDAHDLEKLCNNFAGLPVARGVADFATAVYGRGDNIFRFESVGLNSPLDGPEDQIGIDVILGRDAIFGERGIAIARSIRALRQGDIEAARLILNSVVRRNDHDWLQRLVDLVWLRCADAADDFGEVVATISRIGSADPSLIPLLHLSDMLSHRHPQDYKPLAGSLAPLITLNMLWKIGDDEKAASTLKLMAGQFLRSRAERRPSQLTESAFDKSELIYFLREVCVPSVLDVSRVFAGSKDVIEERQAICGLLHILDPDRADEYSAEVASITRRLKVDEGLKIVDQSRIHVDTDAVTRLALKNLSEDFARYVDLVDAGIGAAGNFDEALREVKEAASDLAPKFYPVLSSFPALVLPCGSG